MIIHHGDCLEILPTLPADSVDSVVTDPPYHLTSIVKRFGGDNAAPAQFGTDGAFKRASRGFMGKQWDGGDVAFRPETWAEVLRVMKPGAHLLAFGGTRTYHRMACAIEDAGFEIRDTICWLYATGFPKSHNLHGDWEGFGTALKPAFEPIILARKPLVGTVAANVLKHGTGGINIDACRVATQAGDYADGGRNNTVAFRSSPTGHQDRTEQHPLGRWPANVIHDGSDEVTAAFPQSEDGVAGKRSGIAHVTLHGLGPRNTPFGGYGSKGSAARFFYSAKADKTDRLGSKHPTVKPIDLMAYLCRLVTPPGGTVLDPFAGSGSTGMACIREGFDCILIEREAEYVADIRRRLAHVGGNDTPLFAEATP